MKIICLIFLLLFNLNCLSQTIDFNRCNENCDFNNGKLWFFSESIADTVYLKLTFRNKISEEFSYSDLIRISYKKKKNKKYSKSYDIKPKEQNDITQGYINSLYEIMKVCIMRYEKFFFQNNIEGIKKLESNHISYYYYNVNAIIIPDNRK